MADPLVRLLVVAAVVAIAVAVGAVSRSGRAIRRRPADPEAPSGLTLFVSAGCDSCIRARDVLVETVGEGGFREVTFADAPELFTRLEVSRVPTMMAVTGEGSWKVEGVPAARRLRRWLGPVPPGGPGASEGP